MPAEENVVTLPQTAVVTSLYDDYVYAVVPAEESTEKEPQLVASQVFVETGSRQKNLVDIVDGVVAGDLIVVAGQNRLANGVPVTPAREDATESAAAADAKSEAAPQAQPEQEQEQENGADAGADGHMGTVQSAEAMERACLSFSPAVRSCRRYWAA